MSGQNSIRDASGSPDVMARRAWWLVGLGILIPGSAQLLAGDRRLGRFAVGTTFLFWLSLVVTLGLYAFARPIFLIIATNVFALWAVQVLLLLSLIHI